MQKESIQLPFEWQGHRAARGLAPENTVAACLVALSFPALTTLELDLAVSADQQLIVSHEPWMSSVICSHPDGRPVTAAEEEKIALWSLSSEQIRAYDCGRRKHPLFPAQQVQAAYKPGFVEVLMQADAYCRANARELPLFNLEIKSQPAWDGKLTPPVEEFARLVVDQVRQLQIGPRVTIQSFDLRALQAVRRMAPELRLSLLVEDASSLDKQLKGLGFTPEVFSPAYKSLSQALVADAQARGMRVIPWTVNEQAEMRMLLDWGVDGMITDYPDRILAAE
jgi:glycerophosphoryl diester phosphodiesterase